jgi:hypothetical protein
MRTISWKVVINDNKFATMEQAAGFPQDNVESQLTIIGILESLKEKHTAKLKTLYYKTIKQGLERSEPSGEEEA